MDVDLPPHSRDAELVDVRLPQRVDVTALEPLERLGLLDDPNHEPVPLQNPMDGSPAHPDSPPAEDGVDPHRAPSGMPSPQLEDAIDQVAVHAVGASVGTAGLVPESFGAFLSVVSAPTTKGALGDPEDLADVGGANPSLQVLSDDL